MEKLGAIALSSDIFEKANIGLWAFELDEGCAPRMYADDTMLKLIGLDHQVSPEETYHAWYDHINDNSYGLVADAVEKMTAGEHAEVQYPWRHPNGETWIVRCGGVRNFEYKAGIRIEGTHQNVTEILHFDEQELAENIAKRDRNIIEILASEYSSVYYIDLTTDELNPYTMNEETETTFGSVFRSGITYSEAYKLYVDKLIFADDKQMMLKAGSLENIQHELANKKTFLTQYRSADNKYSEMKFVKVGGENDAPLAVALGFAEKDEEIRREQQIAEERQRNTDIIEILASEYSSVYYIDLTTDELNPYTMNEETETTFGSVFRSGITYSEAYKLYVDKLIFDDDKQMMLKAGSLGNIRHELTNKKTFLTQYRSADNKYSEMKFVKVGGDNDEPLAVALGFAEKDEEIRREQQIAEERQRNTDIIEILASEYSSVYYIDLTTDELNPYTMNEETETEFGKIFRSGIKYSDAYRLYVNTLIHSEDKQMMLKAGSIGNIMKELRNKKTFLTTYRNTEGHYSEMKFVKVGNEEGVPKAVALGFADKDEELRAKEEESKIMQRNIDIIEILASEYSSVYYIDLTTDELDPYTMNEATETEFGKIFRSGIKYSEAYKMYVDTLVHPNYKEQMLKAGSIYNILKELGDKKTFITQYMDNEGDYSEMKFVKVGEKENPEAVALGFANRNKEIREELERKAADARDRAVISGLSDDFGCVVYVGFNDKSEVHYRFDPLFEEHIPNWSAINNFRDRLDTLIETVMHPDDRQEFYEATKENVVHENVNKDGVYFVNFRTLIDGEVTYYQAKFVKDENSEDHVIAGFHNVDETTKREMDALDKAEIASRAKSSFLFNMSHDIRTPMNAITGFTTMAKKHLDDKDKIEDYLNKIETAGNQLLALINQVLEMSRIESGKIVLSEQKADVLERAAIARTIYSEQAETKGIRLTVATKNILHSKVITDADRMKQIITNIIGNALKYTPEGGSIDYCIEETDCAVPGYGNYVFTVRDTGIGMSPEFLNHIFDEFSRENTSTVSKIQGTGLGMSIVKQLTDLLGGTIDVQSEKGRGTTISVMVPMKWDTETETAAEKDSTEFCVNLDGMKILLVEDNEMNREIAEEILSENGIIIETAEDGDVAVDMVRNAAPGQYDLILMDVQMPRMNGYEATKAIRALEDPEKSSIPIIAMTANAFEEDRQNAIAAGMNEHLAKPIDIAKLVNTLVKFTK